MNLYGIVVAAGRGERFGGPKAVVLLGGVPLWVRAAASLREAGARTVIVVGDVPGGIPGGDRRRDSVAAGLAALSADATHVLVHDAARPLASASLGRAVVARLESGGVDGVVPGIPIADTLKRVEGDRVVTTVSRVGLIAVQTPQGFVVDALRAAHRADDEDATDDAQLVERNGGTVVFVAGETSNLKITRPGDLVVAEAWLP